MPQRYTHLDGRVLVPYANKVLLWPTAPPLELPPNYDMAPAAPGALAAAGRGVVPLSAPLPENQHEGDVSPCFGGKGGTRIRGRTSQISNLLMTLGFLSPRLPSNPRIWHRIWHWANSGSPAP